MNQPTPQQTVARMHRGMRNYVAAQKPSDPICQLPDSHIRGLAGAAFGVLPVPRDTEVTRRAPRRPTAETEAMQLPVLELLASERSVDEIGQVLGLSVGQVDHAMRWLYRRLGVSSRHGAVLAAVAAGWLRLEGGVWRAVGPSGAVSGAGAGDSLPDASAGLVTASVARVASDGPAVPPGWPSESRNGAEGRISRPAPSEALTAAPTASATVTIRQQPDRAARLAAIARRYQAGEGIPKLARESGYSEPQLRALLQRAGVKLRQQATQGGEQR